MAARTTTAESASPATRRFPIGVEVGAMANGLAHARVWAPRRSRVELVFFGADRSTQDSIDLEAEGNGYFSGALAATDGTLYKYRLDKGEAYPDPASRFQPDGPHGPSQIVDPDRYGWKDTLEGWRGVSLNGAVIYELHVGTFTSEGTYDAAIAHLHLLADVGVTILELMPLAEFPGRFGWGYDGVCHFAPYHHYGGPDALRRFVDAAHSHGLGVVLDVVYNHLGPDGNYLHEFSEHYFKGVTEWGDAVNFDGPQSQAVREHFVANAAYWIEEYHLDGLRLDATQQIFDRSKPHIITEVRRAVRAAADGRATIVIAENETQRARLARPEELGGCALDALWNDDFHHSVSVALTGRSEAYYSGYRGTAQELLSTAKYGFLYQGQWYEWQLDRRGAPALDIPAARFVNFVQNHDQIANSLLGLRSHQRASPGRHRAVTALFLLLPQTPMLFQGQEFAASSPFLYFADHHGDLAKEVRAGRVSFLAQFASMTSEEAASQLADPADPATFDRCKLDWTERNAADGPHAEALALVRDLLRLRRDDPAIRAQNGLAEGVGERPRHRLDGAVIGRDALILRFFGAREEEDRLLVLNLGREQRPGSLAEPLVAPPLGMLWRTLWYSEHPRYGGAGGGASRLDTDDGGWWLPGEAAVLLAPVPEEHAEPSARPPRSQREARAQWDSRR